MGVERRITGVEGASSERIGGAGERRSAYEKCGRSRRDLMKIIPTKNLVVSTCTALSVLRRTYSKKLSHLAFGMSR